jgi:hypothetical protein
MIPGSDLAAVATQADRSSARFNPTLRARRRSSETNSWSAEDSGRLVAHTSAAPMALAVTAQQRRRFDAAPTLRALVGMCQSTPAAQRRQRRSPLTLQAVAALSTAQRGLDGEHIASTELGPLPEPPTTFLFAAQQPPVAQLVPRATRLHLSVEMEVIRATPPTVPHLRADLSSD